MRKIFPFLLLIALISGCSDSATQPSSDSTTEPNHKLSSLVSVEPIVTPITAMSDLTGSNEFEDNYLVINRKLLNKELFFVIDTLTGSSEELLPGVALASSKIIFFDVRGGKLFMFESMKEQSFIEPFEPEKIIAEFPIINKSEDTITFDFKSGFNKLITFDDADKAVVNNITASYLKNFIKKDDSFAFTHVVQIFTDTLSTITLNYLFLPAESDMKPVYPDKENKARFIQRFSGFEKKTGNAINVIEKIDISKPFTYYISANTPPEFKQVIKEAILSWNEVFGKEVLKVEDAKEDLPIANPFNNVIQWIGYDELGYAYSMAFANPRTGEIVKAYIVLPSSWAIFARDKAVKLLEQVHSKQEPLKSRLKLAGFENLEIEKSPIDPSFEKFLEKSSNGQIPDEEIQKLIKRKFIKTAIHEAGHNLGLDHNFAGNLGSEITEETENIYDSSLKPSTSIMEYLTFEDDMRMQSPGIFDRLAIKWGYLVSDGAREEMNFPLSCSDSDALNPLNLDCKQHDSGKDPAKWRINKISKLIDESTKQDDIAIIAWDVKHHLRYVIEYLNAHAFLFELPNTTKLERRKFVANAIISYLDSSTVMNPELRELMIKQLLERIREIYKPLDIEKQTAPFLLLQDRNILEPISQALMQFAGDIKESFILRMSAIKDLQVYDNKIFYDALIILKEKISVNISEIEQTISQGEDLSFQLKHEQQLLKLVIQAIES